eukprot:Skav234370  [mRNA]  locus=scaffold2071:53675:57820:- [translate_table: standard]
MVEHGRAGPNTNIYWIVHGTTLLRASAEHLRPHLPPSRPSDTDQQSDPHQPTSNTSRAKHALDSIRNRSTTLYIDLNRSNKRKRSEVTTEDEGHEDQEEQQDEEMPQDQEQQEASTTTVTPPPTDDYWDVSDDGLTWTRVHVVPRQALYVPTEDSTAPVDTFRTDRWTTIRRPPLPGRTVLQDDWTVATTQQMPYTWVGDTMFKVKIHQTTSPTTLTDLTEEDEDMDNNQDQGTAHAIPPPPTNNDDDISDIDLDPPQQPPQHPEINSDIDTEPQHEPTPITTPLADQPMINIQQAQPPPTDTTTQLQNDRIHAQRAAYIPPPQQETFEQMRARVDRQETLSYYQPHTGGITYGPNRERIARATPYHRSTHPQEEGQETHLSFDNVSIQDPHDSQSLPPGWHLTDGAFVLGETHDEWILNKGWLIRKHYLPRNTLYNPGQHESECPVSLCYLSKDRTTKVGSRRTTDRWRMSKDKVQETYWTGETRFKIHPAHIPAAQEQFYTASNGHQTYAAQPLNHSPADTQPQLPTQQTAKQSPTPKTKARKEQISERHLSLEDRLAFIEAKKQELASFFQNDVWEIDDSTNSQPGRVLKAHFILKWSKNSDNTPRAKARLITQGFKDPDALAGTLQTDSPTLSRLGRNYVLAIATTKGWKTFTSDISTAFLQGRKHDDKRTLWISLSAEANRLLGLPTDGSKLLRLKKPMYGLCDAPRAWFLEARTRLTKLGAQQHPLDACLYLLYDHQAPFNTWEVTTDSNGNQHKSPPLCAIFGLHVDDIIGCADTTNPTYIAFKAQLQQTFTFRTWEEDTSFEYCGAQVTKHTDHHYTLGHDKYFSKQKPIHFQDNNTSRPVTDKERTQLRAMIGALQWPSGQSSPHLQAMTSQLAGQTATATTDTLREANKTLRYAKANSDVCLHFQHIGNKDDLTMIAYCDAAFASRKDNTSQGGYLIMLTHHDVTTGTVGPYILIDWRSWKLPRVARSSLSAEAQAASETADSLMYCITFWQLIWHPTLPINDTAACKMPHQPSLVTDAKGLYDLLIKPELQPSSGADKRTSIEVLVTQDKLACTNTQVQWVSSELQFADGMTKPAAAQLLAERLRTHTTTIKPDNSFTAAKKKDATARKKSAEQFAIKRPRRALQALMATAYLAMVSDAANTEHNQQQFNDQHTTLNTSTSTSDNDNTIFIISMSILVVLAVHDALGIFRTIWGTLSRFLSRAMRPTPETVYDYQENSMHVETEECPYCEQLELELTEVREECQKLKAFNEEAGRRFRDTRNRLHAARRELAEIHSSTEFTFTASQVESRLRWATQREAHFTRAGDVWHANSLCGPMRNSTDVISRRPCQLCVKELADESTYRRSLAYMETEGAANARTNTGPGSRPSTG